jgi:hypothetical protein
MAVNCIRQRKQWTADLSTLTDGDAGFGTGSGTPEANPYAYPVGNVINIDAASEIPGVMDWFAGWINVQQPRYDALSVTFALTAVVDLGGSIDGWSIDLTMGAQSDSASGSGSSIGGTLTIDPATTSARPIDLDIAFGAFSTGEAFTVTGTITFNWS